MLEMNYIRGNAEALKKELIVKGFTNTEALDRILILDEKKRGAQKIVQEKQNESNSIAKSIGQLFKDGKQAEAAEKKERAAALKTEIKSDQEALDKIDQELTDLLLIIPNRPHPSVPPGKSEEDNETVKEVGTPPTLPEGAVPHWDLIEKFDIVNLELGTKITGAGFPVFKGKGARLQRGLINFFLDQAREAGYTEYIPPFMVNQDSAYATGQLPDKDGQMYHAQTDNLFLIPTAEVPITNIYRDKILKQEDFPVKMCGHSPCFRREAGSYGKDVRGLNRVHQFEKVEIVQIVDPAKSYEVLDEMVAYVESLLSKLNLHYRVLRLCGGDTSFASALTFDFEVYSAAQEKWLEVSSVSNFETFQSNRMKTRFKNADGKSTLVHTLNGSALALPRIFASILENNQQADGSVLLPEVLHSYLGFSSIS